MTLYLGNLINFDELQTKYEKRIKVRFNTDWKTTGSGVLHSFQEMYFNDNKLMHDWINTPYSEKRSRQFANELVLQFIELDPHQWLFVDAVSVGVKEGHKFTDSVEPEIYKDLWVTEGESVAELEPYKDRLIVNKKNSRQNWFYTNRDIIDTIAVQQILPASYKNIENKFPGFDNVSRSYKELSLVINQPEWK
ncbi:hypothetical protein [Fructobacillus fructosus]|uniref:hypothetical protein n=1 Tax=Fructobacillus fructosus TaxID=1631 RepID=UPI002DB537F0|nr:hypothetical protein R54866_LGPIEIPA_00998 [Fructobacillus fructosus]CAK1244470.1 hypothetical protein LMG30234_GAICNKDF_01070 [Fructobacillus fructosus]CAK1244823.1 hypothetical protein LMG30235_GOPAMIKF_01106 [Fructobacillus fructosus]